MTYPININQSMLVKRGPGILSGLIVNSHNAGTLALYDGLGVGAAATGTLTSSGAMVPATHAVTVFTSDGTAFANGETFTLDDKVYTFKTALSTSTVPYEILIGENAAASLDNMKSCINGTAGAGTTYSLNTPAHPKVVITTNTDTANTIRARIPGVDYNTMVTTETCGHASFADTTLGGGTGASDAGVTTAGATMTIGTRTYTFVVELSESLGATAIPDQILHGAAAANALDNMKLAINESGVAGTNYSTGTYQNSDVLATTNSDTAQVVVARKVGTGGNAIATTETLANYAWGAATLASGTGQDGALITNTFTFSAVATTGERFIDFKDTSFTKGLYAVVGGTAADITLFVGDC